MSLINQLYLDKLLNWFVDSIEFDSRIIWEFKYDISNFGIERFENYDHYNFPI